MDFTSVCRTCLSTKYLGPIFKQGDDHQIFSSTIFITTGLKVEINDSLPQHICRNCMKFIQDVIRFRQRCKDAEKQLLNIKNIQDDLEPEIGNTIQKPNCGRKKTKGIKNDSTSINIKIEPEFEIEDDVPLLQQKLNFTKTYSKHDNVKKETEFVKIDVINLETDSECIKDEEIDNITVINRVDQNSVGNEQKNMIELVNNQKRKNNEKIDKKVHTKEIIDECKAKIGIKFGDCVRTSAEFLESEANMSDESKYEVEFLDFEIESVTDELNKDMEIQYNTTIPKNDIELSKYDMKTLNKPEIHEHIPKFTNTIQENTKKRKHKSKTDKIEVTSVKDSNNTASIKTENTQIDTENEPFNIEVIVNSQVDIEDKHFIKYDSKRVTCKLCQKNLSRRSMYSHIAKSHPDADDRKIKCEICNTYVPKARLNDHMVAMHDRGCFKCKYCKTEYENEGLLSDHESTCPAKAKRLQGTPVKRRKRIIKCDICHKSMQRGSLKLHKDIQHAGMGPVCEHCGHRFGNKLRLDEHLRAKHGYEKFKCSMCDFLSATSMAIRNHERRHRGEKPYVCEQCGAKFHAAHLLAQHRQTHRTEKSIKCDQCPAAFKVNNALHMHKMVCHNNNTYQCPMCPRTYRARLYAVKHLRTVHRHTGAVRDIIVRPNEPHAEDTST